MKAILVLLGLAALACALSEQEYAQKFAEFQHKFHKSYETAEEFQNRYEIFKQNVDRAAELQKREKGSATYGVTKFSDLTEEEFRQWYLMPVRDLSHLPYKPVHKSTKMNKPEQDSFDWNSKGAITPVYDQGQCGSCWAFSATETIESYFFLAGNSLTELSMQQIVDCDTNDWGCNGGWPSDAYEYVMQAGGLDTLSEYPYTGENDACNVDTSDEEADPTNWSYVTQNDDENAMLQWVSNTGPLSICVDASSWSAYTGGVISGDSCTTNIDHCVQLTGYSTQGGIDAWNVRNSWGTDWGNNGYIYLERGQDTCACGQVVTAVTFN